MVLMGLSFQASIFLSPAAFFRGHSAPQTAVNANPVKCLVKEVYLVIILG